MANFFSKLFGSQKVSNSYAGPRPHGTLREAEGGQQTLDELKRRLSGQGVGFGEDYADRVASPVIQRMNNAYRTSVLPELKSELSASGRRRGSAGFDQLRQSLLDQSLAEGDVWSNLYRENEGQKRSEINAALEDLGNYAIQDAGLRDRLAGFEYQNTRHQVSDATERNKRESDGWRNLIGSGITAAALFNPASAAMTALPRFNAGGQNYIAQPPPYGYDYKNLITPRTTRQALIASLTGGYR